MKRSRLNLTVSPGARIALKKWVPNASELVEKIALYALEKSSKDFKECKKKLISKLGTCLFCNKNKTSIVLSFDNEVINRLNELNNDDTQEIIDPFCKFFCEECFNNYTLSAGDKTCVVREFVRGWNTDCKEKVVVMDFNRFVTIIARGGVLADLERHAYGLVDSF